MVAISKELRDKLMSIAWEAGSYQLRNQLRAAPETVSLEGVETSLESLASLAEGGIIGQHLADFPGLVGRKIRRVISDLRRFVAPVQPSLEINTSVFTTKSVCDLRDVSWDLIYRLGEWVGGVESKQDEEIITKAKQALKKLVKP